MATIKFLGHACFLITTDSGVRLLTDPYEPGGFGGSLRYGEITDPADLVTVSHEHADHGHLWGLPGEPQALRESREVAGLSFRALHTFHDEEQGQQRGHNRVFLWDADGLRFVHLGDLGEPLSPEQIAALRPVDVLFIPVGGHFTIDAAQARQLAAALQARIIIPMHYRTSQVDFPIAPVDDFLRGDLPVVRPGTSELRVDTDSLPAAPQIVVLEPAN